MNNRFLNTLSCLAITATATLAPAQLEPASALDSDALSGAFVSIQLRRVSDVDYEVVVFDRSFDANSLAAITVTDLDTSATIFDKTYPTTIGDFSNPGTFTEPLTIGAKRFSVRLRSREFSSSRVYFGSDFVHVGNPPTSQLNDVTREYHCAGEPDWALQSGALSGAFVSIQLRRLSPTNYEVVVFDRSFDANSLAAITVTDLNSGATIFDKTYPTTIGDFSNPGTFTEPLTISASAFSVRLRSQEFSSSRVYFGSDFVHVGNPPTRQLNDVTRCYFGTACDDGEHATELSSGSLSGAFVSIQLRRVGYLDYEVVVFDQSFDANSLAAITVVDLETGATVFDKTYPTTIGDFSNPGTFTEPLTIAVPYFSVRLRTREFSSSRVYFGSDFVHVGNPPTSQLNDVTRCYDRNCDDSGFSVLAGCPAGHHSLGGPVIGVSNSATSADVTISATNLSGSPICGLLVGAAIPAIPLSIIGSTVPNSALCINPYVTFPCNAPATSAQYVLPVEASPSLCGLTLDLQWIDWLGVGMDFGTSQVMRLTVGF